MTTTSSFRSTVAAVGIWVARSLPICVLLIVTPWFGGEVVSGSCCAWQRPRRVGRRRGLRPKPTWRVRRFGVDHDAGTYGSTEREVRVRDCARTRYDDQSSD